MWVWSLLCPCKVGGMCDVYMVLKHGWNLKQQTLISFEKTVLIRKPTLRTMTKGCWTGWWKPWSLGLALLSLQFWQVEGESAR